MRDAQLKDVLCRHFTVQGWYAQPEVVVHAPLGPDGVSKVVTDIDVLGLRPTADLGWETVLGDCKTLKNTSPVNRALWLRGLMDYRSASAGIILMDPRRPVDMDHRLFAASLGVTLLGLAEFPVYDRALLYPAGTAAKGLSYEQLLSTRAVGARYHALNELSDFVHARVWNLSRRIDTVRYTLAEVRKAAGQIDPNRDEHLALVLDAASVFAVGLAECVGLVFHQYLHPNSQETLSEAVKYLIWGGRSAYEFVLTVRQKLRPQAANEGHEESWALPQWERFVHLVRSALDSPTLVFLVPQLLRRAAVDVMAGDSHLGSLGDEQLMAVKLAMLTALYVSSASSLPVEVGTGLADMFATRQSEMVHQDQEAQAPAQVLPLFSEDADTNASSDPV